MRRLTALIAFCLILGAWPGPAPALTPCPKYHYQQTRELVALVRAAAEIIKIRGEAAFDQLRQKGSRWCQGERYIFVDTLDGVEVVNGAFPQIQGQNLWDLMDANNKLIVQHYIKEVSLGYKAEGWTHYLWPKPGESTPSWKTTYVVRVRAPSGKQYVVGSGLYNMKAERCFAVDEVVEAAELIKKTGKAALAVINNQSGEFFFFNTYVFVLDQKGVELANPAFPQLVGRNLWDLKDAEGRYFVRQLIGKVNSDGSGWVSYLWPKPGQKKPSRKHAFVQGVKLDGQLLVVGCGIYLD